MTRQPVLLLDMDGPIAGFDEFHWQICKDADLEFDIESVDFQTKRYLSDHVVGRSGRRLAYKLACLNGFFRSLPVVDGSQEGVELLERAGVDIWICTKPMADNPTCRDEKAAWVREHFPQLLDKMFIAPDKSKVVGDVLLDDAFLPRWVDEAHWHPVVFDRPYNRAGSNWQEYDRWSWEDPIEDLLDILEIGSS